MNGYGLIHLYCGNGKGKTTAAMGLALRCLGQGGRVMILQFLKRDDSGERFVLKKLNNITLWESYPEVKFTFHMTKSEKKCAADWYTATFQKAVAQVQQESYQLLILDEILPCIQEHFLPESLLLDFLEHKPEGIEIVLTGRSASNAIRQKADYITEMKEEKHPYTKGIPSRIGIEF